MDYEDLIELGDEFVTVGCRTTKNYCGMACEAGTFLTVVSLSPCQAVITSDLEKEFIPLCFPRTYTGAKKEGFQLIQHNS